METVLTGRADMPELRFDARALTLTIVYSRGDTRVITAVSQSGFDRLVGKPGVMPKQGVGLMERVWAFCRSFILRPARHHFNFSRSITGGGNNAVIRNGHLQPSA